MPFRVMKFGGTSVGSPQSLARVLEIISHERAVGQLAVVVSAMGDTTDRLIEATEKAGSGHASDAESTVSQIEALAIENATQVLRSSDASRHEAACAALVKEILAPLREAIRTESLVRSRSVAFRDYAMSFGERVSAALVMTLLEARGVPATAVDTRQWTLTDDNFGAARVQTDETFERARHLSREWGDRVAVHAGFIGATADGRTTTLGRNGSDYTAAMLAAALGATDMTVWTDVTGVLTADPALVAEAYVVPHLSQREALELANLGFAMFHPRTMVPLIQSGVPLRIRSTMKASAPGTLVDAAGSPDASRPSCIVTLEDLALVDIEYTPRSNHPLGIGQRILKVLEQAGIPVRVSTQSPLGRAASIVVPQAALVRAQHALTAELAAELQRGEVDPLRVRAPVTLVTLMAEAIGQGSNVAGRFFGALGAVGINVRAAAQGAASRSIQCVVDAVETPLAARSVHAAFNLAHSEVSLLVLGKGVVGRQLLEQIQSQAEKLRRDDGVLLRVVGIAGRDRALFSEDGIDLAGWSEAYASAPAVATDPATLGPLLDRLVRLPVPIIVDCTGADGMEHVYVEAFRRGIHVVGANKKPLALPQKERDALLTVARRHHRLYLYETTVGASLPVIATLKDLVRTGDRVKLIEGSFSGTLGFLANELMRGIPLSRAVSDARERGYTEPHPRDDLSGLDVARKALILARELGIELSLEEIHVEPFVPHDLLGQDDVAAFFRGLATLDAKMTARIDRFRTEGKVLRYLARIDPLAPGGRSQMVKVGPVAIDQEHTATRLRGSEAFVAFTTERYSDYPLVVQGAGAGGAVTAAGVLADVLKVAQTLRGR
jgi:aspartokinase/homoserine dehydrogenase 1